MLYNSGKYSLGVSNNPITDSVYVQESPEIAVPLPPTSSFIISQTGAFIVSETGSKLITE